MSTEIQQKKDIKSLMKNPAVVARFNEILGKNPASFIQTVTSLASTPTFADCDPNSILGCAIAAATLGLSVNPNLGQAAIIAYNSKSGKVAQFQIMTNGITQLAMRSGQIKILNTGQVLEGQLKSRNMLTGEIELDFSAATSAKVVGYFAYLELITGFRATLYMTIEELQAHGKKYSKTYDFSSSVWKTNFDAMANKTVKKRILTKFAPLSIEAVIAQDQSVIRVNESTLEIEACEFVDNQPANVDDIQQNAKM